MENNSENLTVSGFVFKNANDAAKALDEEKRIIYIRSRLDFTEPESVLVIYDKMLKNKIFKTPIGYCFLKEIRDYLINSKDIDDDAISDIAVDNYIVNETAFESKMPVKRKVKKGELEIIKAKYRTACTIIAALICCVIAMFAITLNSDNPNILNYKTAIENKYASWDQELTNREKELRIREKALNENE